MLLVALLTGCGGGHSSADSGPTTTLLTADRWTPPAATGPPSTAKFCTLLVADYQHLASLAAAPKLKVRQEIITDYVDFAPTVIAFAPPTIAVAAKLYLDSIATVLRNLNAVGLDAQKLRTGAGISLLLDPNVRTAGDAVLNFSAQYCHYDIGS